MLPHALTVVLVETELAPAAAWATRTGTQLSWDPERLSLRVVLVQAQRGEKFYLLGQLEGYKALPPTWTFCDENWQTPGLKRNYPMPGPVPGAGSSIFHPNPVICAPFNRLAYQENGGPHADWGGATQWFAAGRGSVQAHTLGDMLAVVNFHLLHSPGRMV